MQRRSIKEIENDLFNDPCLLSQSERQELSRDERKGVQRLAARWEKQQNRQKALLEQYRHMRTYEEDLYDNGKSLIAGIDEVGRGPLAGPVVAAAVILRRDAYLLGINDSKQLIEKDRERFYNDIHANAEAVGVGIVTAEEIDRYNIYQASKKAMIRAVEALEVSPDHLLLDAMNIPVEIPQTSIVKGDAASISIAGASIIAKVTRDRLMRKLGEVYPEYGFDRHMGYATAYHLQALQRYGICQEHRRSFAPVKDKLG